jgi:hypothetical protein
MYIVLALSILSVSVYAWFTLTNINKANLVSQVSGVEAEYQFYIYQNMMHEGSQEQTLTDNVCTVTGEDLCYEYIPNPTYPHLIDGKVAPGERFSFAIKIISVGSSNGRLQLDLGGLQSIGFDLEVNKIQSAFEYEVTKISYIENDVESEDQKDNGIIIYHNQAFTVENDSLYPLVSNVPLGIENHSNSIIVVYFDLYFNPTVYGEDQFGIPYTNSNIFMDQIFRVNHIYMTVST